MQTKKYKNTKQTTIKQPFTSSTHYTTSKLFVCFTYSRAMRTCRLSRQEPKHYLRQKEIASTNRTLQNKSTKKEVAELLFKIKLTAIYLGTRTQHETLPSVSSTTSTHSPTHDHVVA